MVAIGAAIAAAAAGCSGQDAPMGQNALELAMSPAEGAGGAYRPDRPITVQARNGTVENVTVTTKGEAVEGALSADRSQWKSRWSLTPGAEYTVTATGLGKDGKTRTATNRFTTAKVARTVATTLEAPFDKETVGVGIPIILQFDRPVTARAAVEQALEVRSEKPVEGAWHWFGDQQVVFRTKQHWPARTDVEFRAHLAGVRMTKNHWGGKNQTVRFRVGDAHVSKADEDNHTMVVKKNGKTVRTIPVSMGRGDVRKYTTTNGNHLTMEKASPVIMDSSTVGCGPGCAGYYRQTVYSAVRISDSGEYVHSAPWSVGSQGNSNVSHGCLNMSPSNASWFYKFSHRGDPVKITGTSRELEPENGWGYWQLSWKDWVGGSALKRSQHIGPTGDIAAPAS
ncbi:L,D-transpeptidase [Actinomadura flavalba]|uniref:L,D-transpeptidase n=1 Tax=Actinomadura flavalba TaxID=1120938 RepID=UPI000377E438|nr:Ig-like domain-containing protein [Actinomadura flavalba]